LLIIVMIYNTICIGAVVAIVTTGVFHEHTMAVIMIILLHTLFFIPLNLCFAALASRASRDHVEYPYPLPPIRLQRKLRRLLGEEDTGGTQRGTDREPTS